MDPELYEWLFEAVETKFGTAPRFVRPEDGPSPSVESAALVIIETEGGDAVAEVPTRTTQRAVDRLLGNLEARLVRQSKLDVSFLLNFFRD